MKTRNWEQILLGFKPIETKHLGGYYEHCPNCKSIISKKNNLSFTDKTVCDKCKNEKNN